MEDIKRFVSLTKKKFKQRLFHLCKIIKTKQNQIIQINSVWL